MKNKPIFRVLMVLLALALTAALGVVAFAAHSIADVSGDGKITVFDAQLLAEAATGHRVLTDDQQAAAAGLSIQDLLDHILGGTRQTVYLSESGSDSNYGTADAPYATLETALARVSDGGIIHVTGTVAVDKLFRFPDLDKSVTIRGGTLDFTALSSNRDINLRDDMRFEGVAFIFNEGQIILANGNTLYIDENVTMSAPVKLYGGSNGTVLDGTDMTILGGSYALIYGGSYQTEITGDINLVIGGNVNPGLDTADHSLSNNVYGGSNGANIGGKVNMTITGNARVCMVYGGCYGGSATPDITIAGGSTVNMNGGTVMGIFGGSNRAHQIGNSVVNFSGGNIEQIFGGTNRASQTGDVAVNLTGGTIARRVYGGCYNETSGSFDTAYYVTGNVTLTIAKGTSILLDFDDADCSIYARSRHSSRSETEVSTLIFADQEAYDAYSGKLGATDSLMKFIMGSLTAADTIITA